MVRLADTVPYPVVRGEWARGQPLGVPNRRDVAVELFHHGVVVIPAPDPRRVIRP
jgi:hypothetical protein